MHSVQAQEVDRQMVFQHPIILDIIRAQWFGKGKADLLTLHRMLEDQKIFGRVIVLVVTAVCFSNNILCIC